MSFLIRILNGGLITAVLVLSPLTAYADAAPLEMQEAVVLALRQDNVLQQLAAEKDAVVESAVSAGQLPDPKLSLGVINLPTNSYSVGRDSQTMQVVGLEQDFPAGDTRSLAEKRGQQLGDVQQAKIAERRRQLTQDVRIAWLQLYNASHTLQLVQTSEAAFQRLVDIAQVHYENGSGTQQEWLRARLELAMVKERELQMQAQVRTSRAALARWVGEDAADRSLPDDMPDLPMPPAYVDILKALPTHPVTEADNAEIAAAQTNVDIADQAYKPVWGMGVSYGRRPGGDPVTGMPFTNMFSAMVSVSLPIFSGKRQDRTVAAAKAQASASIYARDDRLRELKLRLDDAWARWQQLQDLETLHRETVLPDSSADLTAGLDAYRNGAGDFFELVRAETGDLDARIEHVQIETDTEIVKAQLWYLAGDKS